MPEWATFVGVSSVVTLLLLALSQATEAALTDSAVPDSDADVPSGADVPSDADVPSGADGSRDDARDEGAAVSRTDAGFDSHDDPPRDEPPNGTQAELPRESGDATTDAGPFEPDDAIDVEADRGLEPTGDVPPESDSERDARPTAGPHASDRPDTPFRDGSPASRTLADSMSTGELLANVALSQGVFAVVLVGVAVYAAIPADALGIAFTREFLVTGVALGTAFGLALYVANELGSAAATRLGFDHDEELRGMLAPDSLGGWIVLLVAVLPLVAGFEELLFRGALIGATAAGFGVSPWLLAVVSSVAFALGHGMQGSVGVVVTGLLGFVLAAGFVLTESLLVVIVAHYLINALEFVVHEGLGLEWADPASR